jgi:hypothetical protein
MWHTSTVLVARHCSTEHNVGNTDLEVWHMIISSKVKKYQWILVVSHLINAVHETESSAGKKIPYLLWNPKFQCSLEPTSAPNSQPSEPGQLPHPLFKMHFNNILLSSVIKNMWSYTSMPYMSLWCSIKHQFYITFTFHIHLDLTNGVSPLSFPIKILYALLMSHPSNTPWFHPNILVMNIE